MRQASGMAIARDGAVDVIAGLHIWTEAGNTGDWLALTVIGSSTAAIVVLHIALLQLFRSEHQAQPMREDLDDDRQALRKARRRRGVLS